MDTGESKQHDINTEHTDEHHKRRQRSVEKEVCGHHLPGV